ncbi:MAG: NAD(P)/FAD-dependent oxidoreductase [Polyangiales bacterium]
MRVDVAIVGGGPAGLAVAIGAARRGLSTLVLEARSGPPDKACGEGILPAGVRALDELGIACRLEAVRLSAVRWIDRGGACAEADLPDGGGLGVRRTTLVRTLHDRALAEGAVVRSDIRVRSHRRTQQGMTLVTDAADLPRIDARVLVAADGLASPLRHAAGLDVPSRALRRFGMRRHFAVRPWSARVEVHLGEGMEAYVTPVAADCVGVAILFESQARKGLPFDALLARFPALAARVAGSVPASPTLGAGPFACAARARVRDRFALVGDAAGYVDAVTGEGLSLAFRAAAALCAVLPDAVARDGSAEVLAVYDRAAAADFRKYAWLTRGVLALTRTRLRSELLTAISRAPAALNAAVRWSTS